ncbi:MAG: phospholipase [Bacteroidetes bacterium]|nr:MAG: phospholipase [Bacteroidota bacterium]
METHLMHIETRRTARVALAGHPGPHIRDVWILLHGYRQLAASFLAKCAPLAGADQLLVAPEGLSRFYLDETYGRVGASWMTREDREVEIADQVAYLDEIWTRIPGWSGPEARVHVLGFSQGVATLWRWLLHGQVEPDSVILWAGRPPQEHSEALQRRLQQARLLLVYGDQDPFVSSEVAQQVLEPLQAAFPHLQVHRFRGQHVVRPAPLAWVQAQLGRHGTADKMG